MPQDVHQPARAPWHLWMVGALGLLWNSVGAFDFAMMQSHSPSYMARYTPEQLEILLNLPGPLVALWGLAVWGGVLGAMLLLARRGLAVPVLLVSLLAMSATGAHNFVSADGLYATGGTSPAFVLLIFSVALGLWIYARAMGQRKVLARGSRRSEPA